MAVNNTTQAPQMSTEDVFKRQEELNQQNLANSMRMMEIQQKQAQQQEAISMLSNTLKNAHDAKMNIINNAKG